MLQRLIIKRILLIGLMFVASIAGGQLDILNLPPVSPVQAQALSTFAVARATPFLSGLPGRFFWVLTSPTLRLIYIVNPNQDFTTCLAPPAGGVLYSFQGMQVHLCQSLDLDESPFPAIIGAVDLATGPTGALGSIFGLIATSVWLLGAPPEVPGDAQTLLIGISATGGVFCAPLGVVGLVAWPCPTANPLAVRTNTYSIGEAAFASSGISFRMLTLTAGNPPALAYTFNTPTGFIRVEWGLDLPPEEGLLHVWQSGENRYIWVLLSAAPGSGPGTGNRLGELLPIDPFLPENEARCNLLNGQRLNSRFDGQWCFLSYALPVPLAGNTWDFTLTSTTEIWALWTDVANGSCLTQLQLNFIAGTVSTGLSVPVTGLSEPNRCNVQ